MEVEGEKVELSVWIELHPVRVLVVATEEGEGYEEPKNQREQKEKGIRRSMDSVAIKWKRTGKNE